MTSVESRTGSPSVNEVVRSCDSEILPKIHPLLTDQAHPSMFLASVLNCLPTCRYIGVIRPP